MGEMYRGDDVLAQICRHFTPAPLKGDSAGSIHVTHFSAHKRAGYSPSYDSE